MAISELRPLSIGEILDAGIKIYRRHAWLLLKLALPIILPVAVIGMLVQLSTIPDGAVVQDGSIVTFSFEPDATLTRDDLIFLAGTLVSGLLSFLATLLATGALYKAIVDDYVGVAPDWRTALAFAGRRFHSMLWITVIMIAILIPAFVAIIIPGIWLLIAYSLAQPALMSEDLRGRKALWRSYNLVKGRWWSVFGALLVAFILQGIVTAMLQGLLVVIVDPQSPTFLTVLNAGTGTLATLLVTPFSVAVTTALYFDLRVRKEGFDLELLARSAGVQLPATWAGAPAPPPAAGGDAPPFWPPPPGWTPGGPASDPGPHDPTP